MSNLLQDCRYFRTMGMRLVAGRLLAATDRGDAPRVVVINETMARRYWPTGGAVGVRLRSGSDAPWSTIVGITADVKHRGPRDEGLVQMFVPLPQTPQRRLALVVRTAAPLSTMAALLRDTVRSLDPDLPLANVTTMETLLADAVAQPRFLTWLVGIFALTASALAAIGIYGVMAYTVSQRTSEIGVRLALGASSSDVFALIAGDGLRLAGLGMLAGIAGAFALTHVLDTLLFGVKPTDPLTFAATTVGLTLVALAASCIPARRAVRVDPLVALRVD